MHDFIAIGDTVTDAFIKLSDPRIKAEVVNGHSEITLPFAEKVPFDEVYIIPAVGNAANAAASAAILGLKTAFVSNLRGDQYGVECLDSMKAHGIDTTFVQIHAGKKTNYHYVLWFNDDRTILIKHEEYPYTLPDMGSPKWIYFSSVNEKAYPFHDTVVEYLENHPETKLSFQPGKFEIKLGKDKLSRLYKRSDIFFCNVEEAGAVLGIDTLGIEELLKRMKDLGPKIVVITDGANGAYAYDGNTMYKQSIYPDAKPAYERTGAGDAFASTTASSFALGNDLPTSLQWGSINSMSVVQQVGAQAGLLPREKIEEYLKSAPETFKTQILN